MPGLTEEQQKVYSELSDVIEKCLRLHEIPDDFVLTSFIVLGSMQKFSDDGTIHTVYPVLFKDGDMPWHMIHGLMHKHQIEFNRMSLEHDDNG